jgi:ribosomal protein S18 acetylase RimI-like enzyme
MEQLRLQPMTAADYQAYRGRLIPDYAADHVEAGDWAPAEAETLAARQVDELLPDGPRTAGMLVLTAHIGDGERVGLVWIALDRPRAGDAWIFDIQIDPGYRGQGYGRALLQAAEEQARQRGAAALGLHVFGANTVASNLYLSSGYEVTSSVMRKPLGA